MIQCNVIAVGGIKEPFFRQAADEYKKRMPSLLTETEIKEEKLPSDPSESQISAALKKEGERIIAAIPKKSYVVTMCIEGKMQSSEEFSEMTEKASERGFSSVTFIIGSSYGLSDDVKKTSNEKISLSRLTFPHKLARIILFEAIYRSGEIQKGSKYHK